MLKHIIFAVCIFSITTLCTLAQPCPPGPDGLPDCSGGDPSAPIDGGASLIVLAGAGIAAKKIYDKRKASKTLV
jgi:hypothetical protein